ncbi:PREDICTED: uncharacterized protein LOC100889228, partial [Paramuricea clavata]
NDKQFEDKEMWPVEVQETFQAPAKISATSKWRNPSYQDLQAIFKADFKHIVETRYGKRDAITILRASLQGKPLDMIKGIDQDYETAWEYLDSVY